MKDISGFTSLIWKRRILPFRHDLTFCLLCSVTLNVLEHSSDT
jgi:hypothetical protein